MSNPDSLVADILAQVGGETVVEHYGTKGMKWGIRKDRSSGSVKKAKKGSASADDSDGEAAPKRAPKVSKGSAAAAQKAQVKKMTDTELRDALNRLQMEKQYQQLTAPAKSQNIVAEVLRTSGTQIARNVITQVGTAYVGRALNVNLNRALPDEYKVPIKAKGGDKKDD